VSRLSRSRPLWKLSASFAREKADRGCGARGGGRGRARASPWSPDFRVTCPEARFSANFTRLGFHPGFGLTVTLPDAIGKPMPP
jgi:hypothetical protein